MDYSVFKFNTETQKTTTLFYGIEDIQKADLLAQLAMCHKDNDEVIYISPGWNRGINQDKELYNKALELAKEYKYEKGLTKQEAYKSIEEGKKVTHRYFDDNEYIYMNERGEIITEDNCNFTKEFEKHRNEYSWLNDWNIVQ